METPTTARTEWRALPTKQHAGFYTGVLADEINFSV
jgi:hypothetical protein